MEELLTIKEVANYLRLSPTTIWRWCKSGELTAFKVGRGWRIRKSDVDKMVACSRVREEALG